MFWTDHFMISAIMWTPGGEIYTWKKFMKHMFNVLRFVAVIKTTRFFSLSFFFFFFFLSNIFLTFYNKNLYFQASKILKSEKLTWCYQPSTFVPVMLFFKIVLPSYTLPHHLPVYSFPISTTLVSWWLVCVHTFIKWKEIGKDFSSLLIPYIVLFILW